MPRKKEAREEKQKKTEVRKTEMKMPRRISKKQVDVEEWVSERVDDLSARLGLDILGLSREELITILSKIVEIVMGESRPDIETIARRIKRNEDKIRPLIALGILELRESLSEDQVDYVLSALGSWILSYAGKLYREAKRLGKADYLQAARLEWNKQWMIQRDRVLPPECPVCGFNALMSDYTCLVCGSTPSTRVLAEHYRVEEYIEGLVRRRAEEDLKRILDSGYIIISSTGIKIPGKDIGEKYDIELPLTSSLRERIKQALQEISQLAAKMTALQSSLNQHPDPESIGLATHPPTGRNGPRPT